MLIIIFKKKKKRKKIVLFSTLQGHKYREDSDLTDDTGSRVQRVMMWGYT